MPQIAIEWLFGRPHVGAEQDEKRAIAAAIGVLDAAGADYLQAQDEYYRQLDEVGDEARLTGLALIWLEAGRAAGHALTEGWPEPLNAACTIRAWHTEEGRDSSDAFPG